jgi:hypothetical protein
LFSFELVEPFRIRQLTITNRPRSACIEFEQRGVVSWLHLTAPRELDGLTDIFQEELWRIRIVDHNAIEHLGIEFGRFELVLLDEDGDIITGVTADNFEFVDGASTT